MGFFGPGLVSAASSNDPTTVATLAIIGATTGYRLLWLVVLVVPMLAVVQAFAARIGVVCGTSLQGAIRRHCGLRCAVVTLCAVALVNVITLVADVKAGSEAMSLLARRPAGMFVIPFAGVVGWLLVSHSYRRTERYLSLLPIAFIAYSASAMLARPDVTALVRNIVAPHLTLSGPHVAGAIALLGTTLTSYVYIWESVEVAERRPERACLDVFEKDAVSKMLLMGVIFLFIVVASAATLGKHHLPISTASDAAAALVPLAGPFAATLFALGLLGSAVLAVPILAGTTAYVVAHTFGWPGSLDSRWRDAKGFYAVILGSLAIAAAAAFVSASSMSMLFWASIAGGLATPITLWFLVAIAGDRKVMGRYRAGATLTACAWVVTVVAALVAVTYIVSAVPEARLD